MNTQWNAPISDRFSSLCARVFSRVAAILESEKILGTRLWLHQCQESVKYLTSLSYNAGKITVQCFLSVEEFKPQPLPLSDVFVRSEI